MAEYRSSETAEQEAVISYCDLLGIPIVHISNEGKRSKSYGAMLKRMGLRKGFPDLFITRSRNGFHGLFIEMKYGNNKTTGEQREWLELLSKEGYLCYVCYGAEEAITVIGKYLKEAHKK